MERDYFQITTNMKLSAEDVQKAVQAMFGGKVEVELQTVFVAAAVETVIPVSLN